MCASEHNFLIPKLSGEVVSCGLDAPVKWDCILWCNTQHKDIWKTEFCPRILIRVECHESCPMWTCQGNTGLTSFVNVSYYCVAAPTKKQWHWKETWLHIVDTCPGILANRGCYCICYICLGMCLPSTWSLWRWAIAKENLVFPIIFEAILWMLCCGIPLPVILEHSPRATTWTVNYGNLNLVLAPSFSTLGKR